MKSILKMAVWIVSVLLLLGFAGMAQARMRIKQLGRNQFFRPELLTHGGNDAPSYQMKKRKNYVHYQFNYYSGCRRCAYVAD
jgi:hypothetical protein